MKFKIGQLVYVDGSFGEIIEKPKEVGGIYIIREMPGMIVTHEDAIKAVCEQCGEVINGVSARYCCLQCRKQCVTH